MTPLSEWILFANYSKLQLSSGVTKNSGIILLTTLDSIFAHFITLIQYIIILQKFKRALHIGIIHDHQTKKIKWNDSILRSFITPTTKFEHLFWLLDLLQFCFDWM